jgi:outer membrane cobalamin receptor
MFLLRPFLGTVLLSVSIVICSQSRLDSIQHLNEIVVIGNRYKEVIPAQTLKGTQLEELNSFSVADAIRYFSGVQIKDYGGVGGIKTVDIRSMGTNHMGVFYDGIQLGNAQNGQIDLGKFSLDNIEEISLYNGQKSEIFQSAKDFGSAGTIYLTTRRPHFKGKKKTNLITTFRSGSFGLINPSVLWDKKSAKCKQFV